jgi:hypothetical protein
MEIRAEKVYTRFSKEHRSTLETTFLGQDLKISILRCPITD